MLRPIGDDFEDCAGLRLSRMGVLLEHLIQMTVEGDGDESPKKIESAVTFLYQEWLDLTEEESYFIRKRMNQSEANNA